METHEQTVAKLRRMIDEGAVGEGGRMPPERVLASELGVGRRSLRRALEVLEQEGRISRQQGRGTFIQLPGLESGVPFDRILEHTNPQEVIELRLAMEPVIARLAALRASQCDIKKLQRLAEQTREAGDTTSYEAADAAFHRAVVEASRNALFLAVFDAIATSRRDAGWQRLGENAHCYKRQSVHAGFHGEIAEAIAARDGERAHNAMFRHLSDVQQHIYRHAFSFSAGQPASGQA